MIEHKYYINVLMGKQSKEWKERRGKREKLPKKEQALHHERIPTWERKQKVENEMRDWRVSKQLYEKLEMWKNL